MGKELGGLMDMMDNSPLRSELTTYPQPLLLFFYFQEKGERRCMRPKGATFTGI